MTMIFSVRFSPCFIGLLSKTWSDSLKNRSIRGSFALLIAQFIKFAVQIGTTVVLSRLLLPEDFGILAVVLSTVGFFCGFQRRRAGSFKHSKRDVNRKPNQYAFLVKHGTRLALNGNQLFGNDDNFLFLQRSALFSNWSVIVVHFHNYRFGGTTFGSAATANGIRKTCDD